MKWRFTDWIASYGYQRRLVVLDFIEGSLLTDIDANDASALRPEFASFTTPDALKNVKSPLTYCL